MWYTSWGSDAKCKENHLFSGPCGALLKNVPPPVLGGTVLGYPAVLWGSIFAAVLNPARLKPVAMQPNPARGSSLAVWSPGLLLLVFVWSPGPGGLFVSWRSSYVLLVESWLPRSSWMWPSAGVVMVVVGVTVVRFLVVISHCLWFHTGIAHIKKRNTRSDAHTRRTHVCNDLCHFIPLHIISYCVTSEHSISFISHHITAYHVRYI